MGAAEAAEAGNGGSGGAPGTIELAITSFAVAEGKTVDISVSRSGGTAGVVTVDYVTADGTAVAGSDYVATNGTLTWPDGFAGSRTISIPLANDNMAEPAESFTLTLRNASGATLGASSSATVRLIDTGSTRLSDLSLSVGLFDQIFQPALTDYTATVSLLRSTTTITAVAEDPSSAIRVEGVKVSGESAKLTLDEGVNSFTVEVTAADGVRKAAYTIAVTRRSAMSFGQRAYIKASNPDAGDGFHAVAIDRDTLAVGAPREDGGAAGVGGDQSDNRLGDAGAVYVFARDPGGTWAQQAYLKASNPDGTDQNDPVFGDTFGSELALEGNTLAVAAEKESSGATGIDGDQTDDSAENAGAVYVFERDSTGHWRQTAYIKASNTDPQDLFGRSIALDGDTLAVAAINEASGASGVNGDQADNSRLHSGAVYVFKRDEDGVWAQQAYLKATNPESGGHFGGSVALDGDTLVVGEPQSDIDSGAAYVFTRDAEGVWSQQAYLKASHGEEHDGFGHAVAVDGATLAVSAGFEDGGVAGINGDETDNSVDGSGAVYVFTRDAGGAWSKQAYIKTAAPGLADLFGLGSMALHGDLLVVGAHSGEDGGAAGINGDQADNSARDSGAVYVFTRDAAGAWSQRAYLKASNPEILDRFGWGIAVDLETATIAVGADGEDSSATGVNGGNQSDNRSVDSGAVYVFD